MKVTTRSKRPVKPTYFLIMAIIGVFAAFIGFGKTFFLPVSQGSFKAPVSVHIHGFFAFAWITLFLVQTVLTRRRNYKLHIKLGLVGLFTALGVFVTLFSIGRFTVDKQLADGVHLWDYNDLIGVITGAFIFIALVIAGLVNRKRPAYHKRYLLLATIVVLWPAWFRFRHYFPDVPYPEYWFALVLPYSLIVIAWICDWILYHKIHPVLLWIGSFIIVEQVSEQLMYGSSNWQKAAKWLYTTLYL